MRFGELIPLTGAVLNLSLALFVLVQSPRAAVSRVYLLLGVGFAVWNFGTFWMFRVETHDDALFWARFIQFGVIFIPFALFHISCLVAQIPISRGILWFAYGFHAALFATNFTDFFIADVKNVGYAWYAVAGLGFWIFVGVFSLMWLSVAVLLLHRRKLPPLGRRRITPLILAQGAIAVFGCNDALPILGIYYYPYTEFQVYPFGSMAVIFYGLIVGYSVLQYQLLDVRVTMNRSAAKVVRVLFIFLTGLSVQLVAWLINKEAFTYYSFFAGLGTLMLGAISAAVLFPRLFGSGSEGVERRILGDTFEYQDQVRKFIETMTRYSEMSEMLDDINDLFTRVFQLESYYILLRSPNNLFHQIARSHPVAPPDFDIEIKPHSPVLRYFEWSKGEYLPLSDNDIYNQRTPVSCQAREQMTGFQAQFCFPLTSEGDTFGLLLVGNKVGEQFTATDISLLVLLVKNLSLVINQIRLRTQIQQAQELDILGRMSRGMAHDLNNLLTPIWTLLQLTNESGANTFDEELLPVALRNIKTMRAYIREALFFSENLRPDFQRGRMDLLVAQAAELAKASRRKAVEVLPDTPEEVLAEVDEVLLQRMIANLISNAIDASPAGSKVRVELKRLTKGEGNRDWLRLRIIDSGDGIRKEDLNRVFTPYFTTKNRGDENRGFGLGLAICRKIVNLHGGNLSIASQLKKGTTVQVDLPASQTKHEPPLVAASA